MRLSGPFIAREAGLCQPQNNHIPKLNNGLNGIISFFARIETRGSLEYRIESVGKVAYEAVMTGQAPELR